MKRGDSCFLPSTAQTAFVNRFHSPHLTHPCNHHTLSGDEFKVSWLCKSHCRDVSLDFVSLSPSSVGSTCRISTTLIFSATCPPLPRWVLLPHQSKPWLTLSNYNKYIEMRRNYDIFYLSCWVNSFGQSAFLDYPTVVEINVECSDF